MDKISPGKEVGGAGFHVAKSFSDLFKAVDARGRKNNTPGVPIPGPEVDGGKQKVSGDVEPEVNNNSNNASEVKKAVSSTAAAAPLTAEEEERLKLARKERRKRAKEHKKNLKEFQIRQSLVAPKGSKITVVHQPAAAAIKCPKVPSVGDSAAAEFNQGASSFSNQEDFPEIGSGNVSNGYQRSGRGRPAAPAETLAAKKDLQPDGRPSSVRPEVNEDLRQPPLPAAATDKTEAAAQLETKDASLIDVGEDGGRAASDDDPSSTSWSIVVRKGKKKPVSEKNPLAKAEVKEVTVSDLKGQGKVGSSVAAASGSAGSPAGKQSEAPKPKKNAPIFISLPLAIKVRTTQSKQLKRQRAVERIREQADAAAKKRVRNPLDSNPPERLHEGKVRLKKKKKRPTKVKKLILEFRKARKSLKKVNHHLDVGDGNGTETHPVQASEAVLDGSDDPAELGRISEVGELVEGVEEATKDTSEEDKSRTENKMRNRLEKGPSKDHGQAEKPDSRSSFEVMLDDLSYKAILLGGTKKNIHPIKSQALVHRHGIEIRPDQRHQLRPPSQGLGGIPEGADPGELGQISTVEGPIIAATKDASKKDKSQTGKKSRNRRKKGTPKDRGHDDGTDSHPLEVTADSSDEARLGRAMKNIHSRKFPAYCDHVLSEDLDGKVRAMMSDLIRLQDKKYLEEPEMARANRRYVVGLKEAKKFLQVNKVSLVILAADLEAALLELASEMVQTATSKGVPVVFYKNRWLLGKACVRKAPVSCAAVLNHQGTEANFKAVKELLLIQRGLYQQRLTQAMMGVQGSTGPACKGLLEDQVVGEDQSCAIVSSGLLPTEVIDVNRNLLSLLTK